MNYRGLFIAARILIPSVFVGLGLERLLIAGGLVALIWADLALPKSGGGARA
jgi:hypothetical protein